MSDKLAPTERHKFTHQGQTVYEWDQTLTELNIYVELPPGVRGKDLFVDITATHLRVGLKPNPPYLDKDFAGRVKVSECYWTVEGGYLNLQICKAQEGEPWPCALAGHEIDAVQQQQDQQRLMLERFQTEHPGFDFSNAKFSGEAPNPRTFMGGMSHR
ncbi:hypothetical protein WJX73_002905 [Symbiochloris irregularis]|uniref:CS domain-containing protein n=1 Tax=Symbiochloris irregularis TaxID=706552 RepID=A0AAW1PMC5_9CHLO